MTKPIINALTLAEIASLREKTLVNAGQLIEEAELLASHDRFARAFALSVISIEESAKVKILLECADKIAGGFPQDWRKLDHALHSHHQKLMENLMSFRSRNLGYTPQDDSKPKRDALGRVKDLNLQKQDAFYVRVGRPGPQTTEEHLSAEERAATVIQLAKFSYNDADLTGRGFDAKQAGESTMDLTTRYPMPSEDPWNGTD